MESWRNAAFPALNELVRTHAISGTSILEIRFHFPKKNLNENGKSGAELVRRQNTLRLPAEDRGVSNGSLRRRLYGLNKNYYFNPYQGPESRSD